MEEKIPVNDGGGLYDNEGLCDTLIVDCNSIVKSLTTGNYIQFCAVIVEMIQKLTNLKKGIKSDMGSMVKKVEELKQENRRLMEEITGLPAEREDANGAD